MAKEHVFYAYQSGPLFMASLETKDEAAADPPHSRHILAFQKIQFNYENLVRSTSVQIDRQESK